MERGEYSHCRPGFETNIPLIPELQSIVHTASAWLGRLFRIKYQAGKGKDALWGAFWYGLNKYSGEITLIGC